jgi:hypothetical protein
MSRTTEESAMDDNVADLEDQEENAPGLSGQVLTEADALADLEGRPRPDFKG